MTTGDLNTAWAGLIVEELIRNGVDYFCIAPGSRSTPLALAVANNPKAKPFIHFDERGLAFHALGYSSAILKPSVVITTSGSAVANLLPAILEASKKKVPLIILTADRPPELRFTGDNQVIDQVKIFGDYVRWFADLPTPTTDIAPAYILTTIDQAISRAQGELKGPVHINCMFREPLIPTGNKISKDYLNSIKGWQLTRKPYTQYTPAHTQISSGTKAEILKRLASIKSGLIAVGKLRSEAEESAVIALAKKLNWPIFPDVTSGLRLKKSGAQTIPYFDLALSSPAITGKLKLDGVLQLGGRLTSKRFYDYLRTQNIREYITALNHPLRNDPLHQVTLRIQSSAFEFCDTIIKTLPQRVKNPACEMLSKLTPKIDKLLDKGLRSKKGISEAQAVRALSGLLPNNSALFLASSLPIREMDTYGQPTSKELTIAANRGASGIDGTIASAAGFAAGCKKTTTVLLGDLAFLYDINSLAMCRQAKQPFILIVLNNNGGGIFQYLPIAKMTRDFEKFFATPQNLTFESAAKLFKLNYANPKTIRDFEKIYRVASAKKTSTIIEIQTNREENTRISSNIQKAIANLAR